MRFRAETWSLNYRADMGDCGPAPLGAGAGEPLLARHGYVARHDLMREIISSSHSMI